MCQVLRHQSRLSHRRRRPPPPPLFPSWPSRIQLEVGGWGGGGWIALGAKKCCRGVFTTADVWLSSCSHSISPLQDAGQNVCEDSQPSQWLFRKREKKRGGRRGGGAEWRPPLRVTSCLSLQNREEGDSAPPSAAALILGGLSLAGGRGAATGSKTGVP